MKSYLKEPDELIKAVYVKIPQNAKVSFFSTLIFGFLTHLFFFTNHLINHDAVVRSIATENDIYILGRWFLKYASLFSSQLDLDIVTGTISIVTLAFTVSLTVMLFEIKKISSAVLISGLFVTFPTVTSVFLYRYTADAYMIALALATFAVYLTVRYKNGFLIGGVLLAFSIGIYQAYLAYAISLLGVYFLVTVLKDNFEVKELILKAVKFISFLILGTGIYFLLMKLVLYLNNASLSTYQGIDKIGQIDIYSLPSHIKESYLNFYGFYFNNTFLVNSSLTKILYLVVFILIFYFLLRIILKKNLLKKPIKMLIAVALVLFLPLLINIITILVPEGVHMLMLMSFVHTFVLLVILLELNSKFTFGSQNMILWYLGLITLLSVSYNYYLFDNKVYFRIYTQYENTYAFANRLVVRLQENDLLDNPVAIIGSINRVNYPSTKPNFKNVRVIGLVDIDYIAQSPRHIVRFVNDYIGVKIKQANPEQTEKIVNSPQFTNMPLYPAEDSIKVINGITVVKIDEYTDN